MAATPVQSNPAAIRLFIYYVVFNNIAAVKAKLVANGVNPSDATQMTNSDVIKYLTYGFNKNGSVWLYNLLKGIKQNPNANNFTTDPQFLNIMNKISLAQNPNYDPSLPSTFAATGLCGSVWTSWLTNCSDNTGPVVTQQTTGGIKGAWAYLLGLIAVLIGLIWAYRKYKKKWLIVLIILDVVGIVVVSIEAAKPTTTTTTTKGTTASNSGNLVNTLVNDGLGWLNTWANKGGGYTQVAPVDPVTGCDANGLDKNGSACA